MRLRKVSLMTQVPEALAIFAAAPDELPVQVLARQLAAAGFGVRYSRWPDTCQLVILGMASGKSCLTFDEDGQARWHYEPAARALTSPATITAIITYLLGAPHAGSQAVYRGFPLKGAVGRMLQDRGLTVALRVSEDWESFEATTEIDVSSPERPRLGTVSLSDRAELDWCLDWRAAFHGDAAALIDVISPILRASYAEGSPG